MPVDKKLRIIGVGIVTIVLIWGLTYEWTPTKNPFEELLCELDLSREMRGFGSVALAILIATVEW